MLEVGNEPGRHKKLHSVYCRCSDKNKAYMNYSGEQRKNVQTSQV